MNSCWEKNASASKAVRELLTCNAAESRRRFSSKNVDRELVYNDELTAVKWALNSAVECHLHTVEVIGSNPIAPTIFEVPLRQARDFDSRRFDSRNGL